jgi:hypothetical protein
MRGIGQHARVLLALGVVLGAVSSASATTLIRMGLDELVAQNALVVQGRVVDVHSYWNAEGTFVLTDVTLAVDRVLKGSLAEGQEDVTITVMGGTVGEKTVLIVGGPELQDEASYVLFLNTEELPGAPAAVTVRDLCQGTFDVIGTPAGPRAVSQATRHPLLPDARGTADAPGGTLGIELEALVGQVRNLATAR